MNALVTLFFAPIAVVLLGLLVEYWIVKPARAASARSNHSHDNPSTIGESFPTQLARLLTASGDISTGQMSAKVVSKVGLWILIMPAVLFSIISTALSIPLFIALSVSEQVTNCRFRPTCKQYLLDAIETHGATQGLWLSVKRTVRCNPFFHGGEDPVPAVTTNYHPKMTWVEKPQIIQGFQATLKAVMFLSLAALFETWLVALIRPAGFKTLVARVGITPAILFVVLFYCFAISFVGRWLIKFIRSSWWFVFAAYLVAGMVMILTFWTKVSLR